MSTTQHFSLEVLNEYVDGRLAGPEEGAIRRHLAECSACLREVETLQQTVHLLRRMPAVPVPRSFVLPELPYRAHRPLLARMYPWFRTLSAAAAAALVLLTGLEAFAVWPSPGATPSTTMPMAAPLATASGGPISGSTERAGPTAANAPVGPGTAQPQRAQPQPAAPAAPVPAASGKAAAEAVAAAAKAGADGDHPESRAAVGAEGASIAPTAPVAAEDGDQRPATGTGAAGTARETGEAQGSARPADYTGFSERLPVVKAALAMAAVVLGVAALVARRSRSG